MEQRRMTLMDTMRKQKNRPDQAVFLWALNQRSGWPIITI
jgi:hypothetical protein